MSTEPGAAHAVEFLPKPFREQDILDAVRVALERDRARHELQIQTQSLRTRYDALSDREQQVMRLVCAGLMNKQVAAEIGVSEVTVKVHRHNLMKKLDFGVIGRTGEDGGRPANSRQEMRAPA